MARDVKDIAEDAVNTLCIVGAWGLDRTKQDALWDEALHLRAELDEALGIEPSGSAAFLAKHESVEKWKKSENRG